MYNNFFIFCKIKIVYKKYKLLLYINVYNFNFLYTEYVLEQICIQNMKIIKYEYKK